MKSREGCIHDSIYPECMSLTGVPRAWHSLVGNKGVNPLSTSIASLGPHTVGLDRGERRAKRRKGIGIR